MDTTVRVLVEEHTYMCGGCGAETFGTLVESREWYRDHREFQCPRDWTGMEHEFARVTYESVSVS